MKAPQCRFHVASCCKKFPSNFKARHPVLAAPRDMDATWKPSLFDATLDEMLSLAGRNQPGTALKGWMKRQGITEAADVGMLAETYEALRHLQSDGRNHIWGYVARNLSRPIWLASENQKADVVVGNPPWLAYRAMNKPTQKRFMEEMKASGLWGGLSSVSGYDLSAYFVGPYNYTCAEQERSRSLCHLRQ